MTIEHVLGVVAEWTAVVGTLTYVYQRAGPRAAGLASLALLFPPVVGGPIVASLLLRYRVLQLRRMSFAGETVLLLIAAAVALIDGPLPIVIAATALAIGMFDVLRPSAAMLLPWAARSTHDLVRANLWSSHTESAGALFGPLLAAGLVAIGGIGAPFVGCAAATLLALGLSIATGDKGPPASGPHGENNPLRTVVARIREHPWTAWVFVISSARHFIMGAFDLLTVIIAFQALDLGPTGPGLLSATMGLGAFASAGIITIVARRHALGWAVLAALLASCVASAVLAVSTAGLPAYVMLGVVGLAASLLINVARMLLQRAVDPAGLGPMFAVLGLAGGVGQMAGSATAQVLVAVGGLDVALLGVGAVVGLVAVLAGVPMRRADRRSDVPVVEMSLLRGLALFEALAPITLEEIARNATRQTIIENECLVEQGTPGDVFYMVVDGTFDVMIDGERIRSIGRGGGFGEVALLADVPRTASVVATSAAEVLVIRRGPFLAAITGHRGAFDAARTMLVGNRFSGDVAPDLRGESTALIIKPGPGSLISGLTKRVPSC